MTRPVVQVSSPCDASKSVKVHLSRTKQLSLHMELDGPSDERPLLFPEVACGQASFHSPLASVLLTSRASVLVTSRMLRI